MKVFLKKGLYTESNDNVNGDSLELVTFIKKVLYDIGLPVESCCLNINTLNAPNYTTSEITNLKPISGSLIFNSTTNKLQVYANSVWVDLH